MAIVAYAAIRILLLVRKRKPHPMPPGPKPWPILGNITDLPQTGTREWEFWLEHKDKYGPISSVTALGTTIIVLNSPEVAFELLEKRSATYSSRPNLIFGNEMCGWGDLLATQFYNDRLRAYRRPIHALVGTKAGVSRYNDLIEVEVHRFLLRVLNKPADLLDHIRTEAGAIILKMAYGYTIEPHNRDPLVDIADEAILQFSAATVPGAWLVDTISLLRHLPSWMPGAGFQKTAIKWKATLDELAERPMQFVRKKMKDQDFETSYVSAIYEKADGKLNAEEEHVLKYSAASLYTGGADTSVSSITTFFLAMVLHPQVQIQAREEIDRVVGDHRLPTAKDREKLPYVEAIVKEVFRFQPVAPMGLPHLATEDDLYEGYMVPKDAIIIPNIWWFTHDPSKYAKPEVFDPSRFLGSSSAPDPYSYVFGFGRRICPGKMLADASVWLTVARSLAVFDISKFRDDAGNEIEPTVKFSAGILSHAEPFKASIKPRSPKHEDLIRQVEKQHPWEKSSASDLDPVAV